VSSATAYRKKKDGLLTIEELPDVVGDALGELIAGRFVPMTPTGRPHARTEVRLAARLETFVTEHGLGEVYTGEVGILIRRNPDTLRGADIAFVSKQRLVNVSPDGFLDVAPDLVVEIISPSDRWTDVMEKIDDYFAIGVSAVWIVNPKRSQISIYRSATDVNLYQSGAVVSGEPELPGFTLSTSDIFPA
jgi:Uma2 family endonuclease